MGAADNEHPHGGMPEPDRCSRCAEDYLDETLVDLILAVVERAGDHMREASIRAILTADPSYRSRLIVHSEAVAERARVAGALNDD